MFKKLNKNNKPFKTTASNGPLSLINRDNILFFDSFTAPDGTTLATHVPDIDNVTEGVGWFRDDADFEIISGRATNRIIDPTELVAGATMTGYNDHYATASIEWTSTAAPTERTSIRVRGAFEIGPRAFGDFFFILESGTLRASTPVALSSDTVYPITGLASGTTVTGTINGGNSISYNSAPATGAEVGLRIFAPNSGTRVHFYDNFKVERVT